jgi:hypothetical protein
MLVALFDAARSRTERYVMDASHEERKRWSSLESREPELNQAIVDVSREDFLVGNFDLKSLFSLSVGGFYSDDCVLWLGTEEMIGKTAAFQRMASVLEPICGVGNRRCRFGRRWLPRSVCGDRQRLP